MNKTKSPRKWGKNIVSFLRRITCAFSFGLMALMNGGSAKAAGRTITLDVSTEVVGKITKISDLIGDIATAFGAIIAIFGAIYLGKSLMSRQNEERGTGVAIIIGGIIIASAAQLVKWLLA